MAHCVYTAGRPIGNEGVDRLPVALATKLVPIVMQANGMVWTAPDSDAAADGTADPKA
jgi:hypothetical protein